MTTTWLIFISFESRGRHCLLVLRHFVLMKFFNFFEKNGEMSRNHGGGRSRVTELLAEEVCVRHSRRCFDDWHGRDGCPAQLPCGCWPKLEQYREVNNKIVAGAGWMQRRPTKKYSGESSFCWTFNGAVCQLSITSRVTAHPLAAWLSLMLLTVLC